MCLNATAHVWKSQDSLWKSILSFHHVHSGYQTQVIGLGSKVYYLLIHLADTANKFS